MCRQRCALILARRACACACMSAHQRVLFDRQFRYPRETIARPNDTASLGAPLPPEPSIEYASATVSRPSRPKVTTLPRRTAGSKSARRYRQSPLEYAPATVSRPSRPKVTALQRRTAGVQKRAPLPPEPSRARRCHGFAPLETKIDDHSPQNRGGSKPRAGTARALYRARPCHGFAPLETKSDDLSTQNRGGPKARAATAPGKLKCQKS